MKKFIIIIIIFFNACAVIPHYKAGYIITKDGNKYILNNGNFWINQNEVHTDYVTVYKKDIKEIHLEY